MAKGGEAILTESWFCTILQRSPNVTNGLITEQNALGLLCIQNPFRVQKINLEVSGKGGATSDKNLFFESGSGLKCDKEKLHVVLSYCSQIF